MEKNKTLYDMGYRKIEDLSMEDKEELVTYIDYHFLYPDCVFPRQGDIFEQQQNYGDNNSLPDNNDLNNGGDDINRFEENCELGRDCLFSKRIVMGNVTLAEHFANHPFKCNLDEYGNLKVSNFCIHRNIVIFSHLYVIVDSQTTPNMCFDSQRLFYITIVYS